MHLSVSTPGWDLPALSRLLIKQKRRCVDKKPLSHDKVRPMRLQQNKTISHAMVISKPRGAISNFD